MAHVRSPETVDVTLSRAELSLIRRALRLVGPFGTVEDEDPARELLADLEEA